MKTRLILFCGAFLGAALIPRDLVAQQTQAKLPELPPGPLVISRAPDFSKWVIKRVDNSDVPASGATGAVAPTLSGAKGPKVFFGSQFTMTKTGKIILRETQDDKGQTWTAWCVGDLQVTIWPNGKDFIVQPLPINLNRAANPFYIDYSKTDFPGFEWVSLPKYAGIQSKEGRPCIVFKNNYRIYSSDLKPSDVTAYVDLKTRYPVALAIDNVIYDYEFQPPPAIELVIDPLVKPTLDARLKSTELYTPKAGPN